MTIDNFNRQLQINAVARGLLLGLIVLALSIFSYYFIVDFSLTAALIVLGPYLFAIIIPLLFIVFFCLDMRKALGGYWTFRQAVTAMFIMFLASYFVLTIGRDVIFSKLIEPQMMDKTERVMMHVREQSLKASGASQKEVNSQMIELQKQINENKNIGIGTILQSYLINIILLFVLALVFGSIFKKDRPYIAGNENC